jgi:hypothetical protein
VDKHVDRGRAGGQTLKHGKGLRHVARVFPNTPERTVRSARVIRRRR